MLKVRTSPLKFVQPIPREVAAMSGDVAAQTPALVPGPMILCLDVKARKVSSGSAGDPRVMAPQTVL